MKPSVILDAGLAETTLPRDNGAPVFDAPWQGRALALAVLAVERTGRQWDDFRENLIACIAEDAERPYWESWVAALDEYLLDCDLDDSAR